MKFPLDIDFSNHRIYANLFGGRETIISRIWTLRQSRGKRLNLSPSNHLSSKTPNFSLPLANFTSPGKLSAGWLPGPCVSLTGGGFLDSGTGWHVTRNNEANNESGLDNAVLQISPPPLAKILRAFLASRSCIRPP